MPAVILRRLAAIALCVLALLAGSSPANGAPPEELARARETFLAGQFEQAIPLLVSLLYPTSRLADGDLLAEAHLLLGVSYLETGKPDAATREFEEALFLDQNLALSTSIFSEEAVRFFDRTKSEVQRRARESEEKERLARERDRLRRILENLVVLEKRRYYVNFIPFGAGQFQNGDRTKGVFFFVAQAVTGGTSVALWSYQVNRYGLGGEVPGDEVATVQRIQVAQIATGAAFFGLVAWGIIDSLANYEHTIQRKPDPSVLEDMGLGEAPKPTTFRLLPHAGPGGGGLTLSWEF